MSLPVDKNLSLTFASMFLILSYTFAMVFPLWPLLMLAPLQRRRNILVRMLVVWGVLAIMRIFLFFAPTSLPSYLIPEPFNTILFLGAGAALISLRLVISFRQHKDFEKKVGGISTVDDLLNLSPTEYENMVMELYQAYGHQARRTGATGDHGVDVVIQTKNGEKWVVQCKRWRGNVGEPIVRDFYGTMQHEKADKGAVITTGRFTQQAKEWVKGKPIYLYDGAQFIKAWKRAKAQKEKSQPEAA